MGKKLIILVFLVVAVPGLFNSCKQKEPRNIAVEITVETEGRKLHFIENNNEIASELWDKDMQQLISRTGEKLPDGSIAGKIADRDIIFSYVGGKLQNSKIMESTSLLAESEFKDDELYSFKIYDKNGNIQTRQSLKKGIKDGITETRDIENNIKIVMEFKDGQPVGFIKWFSLNQGIPMGIFTLTEQEQLARGDRDISPVLQDSCNKGVILNCAALGARFLDASMKNHLLSNIQKADRLFTLSCNKGEMLGCYGEGTIMGISAASSGNEQLKTKSKALIKQACDNGATYACYALERTK